MYWYEVGFGQGLLIAVCALLLLASFTKLYGLCLTSRPTETTLLQQVLLKVRPSAVSTRGLQVAVCLIELMPSFAIITGRDELSALLVIGLGVCFVVALVYGRSTGYSGDCGCIAIGASTKFLRVSGARFIARAIFIVLIGCTVFISERGRIHHIGSPSLLCAGFVAGCITLGLLSVDLGHVRRGVCQRPLWRPATTRARLVKSNPIFRQMVRTYGEPRDGFRYEPSGCIDKLHFRLGTDALKEPTLVVFSVQSFGSRISVCATVETS